MQQLSLAESGSPEEESWRIARDSLDICYWKAGTDQQNDSLFRQIRSETPWRSESIQLFGKARQQPRLTAWHGDSGAIYRYSGRRFNPLPWTATLLGTKEYVERKTGEQFNSVLLNYYRDGKDSMGMHADDEPELGEQPAIASLSLGATRRFVLKHRFNKNIRRITIDLANGSLLLMRGPTQSFWKHGVPKTSQHCGERINLTFRKIVPCR